MIHQKVSRHERDTGNEDRENRRTDPTPSNPFHLKVNAIMRDPSNNCNQYMLR